MKWHQRFYKLALEISSWSKDSTKVGAVIVTPQKRVVSTGYNGEPYGASDSPSREAPALKYLYREHAERNAIYNAAAIGVSIFGASLYSTKFPCADCARAIVQAGLARVVCPAPTPSKTWAKSQQAAKTILQECSVEILILP